MNQGSGLYLKYYARELEALVGRPLKKEDGFEEIEITKCEEELGFKLPKALFCYFLLAGRLELNKEHNVLYDPADVFIHEDVAVFMEENQRVVFWGIRLGEIAADDPAVYQGANTEPMEWYPENMSFSEFIIKMWKWQRDPSSM